MISNHKKKNILIKNNFDYVKTYLEIKELMNYHKKKASHHCFNCSHHVHVTTTNHDCHSCHAIGEMSVDEALVDDQHLCDHYKMY